LKDGSQYVGIETDPAIDLKLLEKSFDGKFDALSKISIRQVGNRTQRIQIVLYPKDEMMSLKDWKEIWDGIGEALPEIQTQKQMSENGRQGKEFREAQDKIKQGKDAWLSQGVAFVGGRAKRMSQNDFKRIEELKTGLNQLS
jgi:hypothetical protein